MRLTIKQLKKACDTYPYLMVHWGSHEFAVNSRIAKASLMANGFIGEENLKSNVSGFYPISFQEYISRKIPFLCR